MRATKLSLPALARVITFIVAVAVSRLTLAVETQNGTRPDLSGVVHGADLKPISNAMVLIDTAAPKHGPSTFCPSCYADCRKRATTDARGKFTISSLDPDLRFRVLIVASGMQPQFVSKVDPAVAPIDVTLKPQSGGAMPIEKVLGRVVDNDGTPVANAIVNIRGVTRSERTQFGGNDDVDPVAISDSNGSFMITSRNPFDSVGVDVDARGLAKGIFQNLTTGGTVHELKLTEGASIKGRVMKDGKPLSGVVIDVSGANREASAYVGDFSVATDANGKFLLANLPPQSEYVLCGTMESLGERGCIPATNVRAGNDGEVNDMGDVAVQTAFVLAGQIHLTDGKPLPEHEHVQLGRETPWDALQIETDETGHFRFVGVPPEQVNLYARVPGYRYSSRNVSLNPVNAGLTGRMVTNKTDLILEFEPGINPDRPELDWAMAQTLAQEPLRGAEATGKPASGDIEVTGTVVDADTQKPVPAFTVTEGRKNSYNDEINWLQMRQSVQSNGAFTVYLSRHSQSPPAISIEANGYVPKNSGLITTDQTNLVFTLKKGSGPAGVVLQPDGQPAIDVTVYLADAGRNGLYAGEGDKLVVRDQMYRGTRKTKTDSAGHFSFPPQIDPFAVLVVDPVGFAQVRVTELETNPTVHLQKYARVEGQLMIGGRPGTNESVRLDRAFIPYADYPRQFPPMNLFLDTHTDGNGKFVFERVPPIAVDIFHEPKVRDNPMGVIAESQKASLVLEPGEVRRITLGGKGRPVIGRLLVNGYEGTIDFRSDVQRIENVLPQPPEMPDMMAMSQEFAAKIHALDNDEARRAAEAEFQKKRETAMQKTRAFYQSEAGRRYLFSQHRYALDFLQDGSFRIEDVPGGKYRLQIELHESGGSEPFNQPLIGSLTKEFTVPNSPGGRSDEPFDLGALEMAARHILKAGKSAPDFQARTLDEKPLKLSDFKGKFVLLDFWATWCGPCVAETPYLKATWNAFKNEPRFAMISLSLDPEAAAPRKFVAKNQTAWTQGFLGEWSKSDVPDRFGVDGIPAIFLIGPDGKIIERDLRGDAIKTAVGKALQRE